MFRIYRYRDLVRHTDIRPNSRRMLSRWAAESNLADYNENPTKIFTDFDINSTSMLQINEWSQCYDSRQYLTSD